MQFYFIRHGQSENNALWDRGGQGGERRQDPELTDLGHQQAACVARFLCQDGAPRQEGEENLYRADSSFGGDAQNVAGFQLTHLYCSSMIRAIDTGTYISQAIDLPLVLWEEAHEVGGIFLEDQASGEMIGLPGNDRGYLRQRYGDLVLPEGWGEGGWWNRPFEEREQRILRAQCFHRELLHRHGESDDRVAVVSHAGFFNYWMMVALEWPARNRNGFVMNNAAITRVDIAESTRVMYVNRTDHLPRHLIS